MKTRSVMSGLAALTAVGMLYSFVPALVNNDDVPAVSSELMEDTDSPEDITAELAAVNNLAVNSYNNDEGDIPDPDQIRNVNDKVEQSAGYEAQPDIFTDSVSITPLFDSGDDSSVTMATEVPAEFSESVSQTEIAEASDSESQPVPEVSETEAVSEVIPSDTEAPAQAEPSDTADTEVVEIIETDAAPQEELITSENLLGADEGEPSADPIIDDSISFEEIAKKMAEMDRAVTKNKGISFEEPAVTEDFWNETVSSAITTFISSAGTSFETVSSITFEDPNGNNDNAVSTTALIYSTLSGEEILTAKVDGVVQEFDAYELICMIVSTEMSPNFSTEALKAQAVAAYSYVKYHNEKGLVPSVLVKRNVPQEVSSAVAEVMGKCVYYNGFPAQTMYTASTAGASADPKYLWGGSFPYLVSVDTSFDADFDPNWGYVQTYSEAEIKSALEKYLGITLSNDPSKWLNVTSRVNGRYVSAVDIDGQTTVSGMKIREKILKYKLKSWAFDVSYADGVFTFVTYGYGHGVGMSQNGANYLGKLGWTYDQILGYYFPGTTIE